MKTVTINAASITDWNSFHEVFAIGVGFPSYYGKNMNAWIDCMGDENIVGKIFHLKIENMSELKDRLPDIHAAIYECSAFVNYRASEVGEEPVLLLSTDS